LHVELMVVCSRLLQCSTDVLQYNKMIDLSHNLSSLMRETQASIYCVFFIYGKKWNTTDS
jgi:hypothetical protein